MSGDNLFVILPLFAIVSCITVICILSYCKSRVLKNPQTPVNDVTTNRRNHVNAAAGSSESNRPATAIFIVPTTNQVIQMYLSQANANAARGNNVNDYRCKPPPSYGAVMVDIPPSYDQALEHLDNGTK